MSKYLVKVTSEVRLEDDEALQEYLEVREQQWGHDQPVQIELLKSELSCTLTDEDGTTTIKILKMED